MGKLVLEHRGFLECCQTVIDPIWRTCSDSERRVREFPALAIETDESYVGIGNIRPSNGLLK